MKKLLASLMISATLLAFIPMRAQAVGGIAYDATSRGSYTSSALSWTHTTGSGSDRYLVVMLDDESGDGITAVTYNGVSMTLLIKQTLTTTPITMYFWGLAAPATGANTIAVTNTGGHSVGGISSSYTGVKQTGQPDATASSNATGVASPKTTTVTTVAANSWGVLLSRQDRGATASTNSTWRAEINGGTDGSPNGESFYDSNGPFVSPGSNSMSLTFSGSALMETLLVSLSPAPSTASFNFWQFFEI